MLVVKLLFRNHQRNGEKIFRSLPRSPSVLIRKRLCLNVPNAILPIFSRYAKVASVCVRFSQSLVYLHLISSVCACSIAYLKSVVKFNRLQNFFV